MRMRGGMRGGGMFGGSVLVEHKPHIKNKIIPSSPRGAKLRQELLDKIVPWEDITFSLDNFPYYVDEHSKNLILECVSSHVKHNNLKRYRGHFPSSSQRILLQTIPGTELYRKRLVSALARELQVSLLNLGDDHHLNHDNDYHHNNNVEYEESDEVCKKLKKGERVMYVGYNDIPIEEVHNRVLTRGQRGEVYEVDGDKVAVVFHLCGLKKKEVKEDEILTQGFGTQAVVIWLEENYVSRDRQTAVHDSYIAMDMLYEVLESRQPVIVYFPEDFWGPAMSDYSSREEFSRKVKKICSQLPSVIMICPQIVNQMTGFPYNKALEKYIERSRRTHDDSAMRTLFTNVVCVKPPEDEELLNTFIAQIEEDRLLMIPQGNLSLMHKVLKDHNLVCMNLEHANIEDKILTRQKVEKIIGWATNHYLSSCPLPCVNEGKLHIPHESIKLAILRLEEEETPKPKEQSKSIEDLATGHEKSLVPAVVSLEDNDLKFNDVGGLENVKKALYESVILPIRRPELFSHGSLFKPCKGILLFGPRGTGKSLVVKALATELGANFINITAAFAYKWVGDTEILTRALFSYATKLAPVVIFLDEVDRLLGAHGNNNKYDTSRLKGFVAVWDGLKSEERQGIVVIGATNRPFDIDEAVICRMSRRIYAGLPDVESRSKILKLLLNKENLESGFSFEQLAEATEGYSGNDLKNLCVAAAYRPVEDLLEQESKGKASDGVAALRPLNVDDFIHSKARVKASVAVYASNIVRQREWNELYGEGDNIV